jgi:Na+/H+ antiporter NhaC
MDSVSDIFQNIPYQVKIAFLVILLGFIFYYNL